MEMIRKFWHWLYYGKAGTHYASFERRMVASMIDTVLLSLAVLPLFTKLYNPALPAQQVMRNYLAQYRMGMLTEQQFNVRFVDYMLHEGGGALLLSDLGYQFLVCSTIVVIFWLCRGATPGKMLLKMKIVDAVTETKPSARQLLIRYLGYIPAVLPLMLGFVWIYWDKKRQGWHDKLAGTVVIVEQPKEKAA